MLMHVCVCVCVGFQTTTDAVVTEEEWVVAVVLGRGGIRQLRAHVHALLCVCGCGGVARCVKKSYLAASLHVAFLFLLNHVLHVGVAEHGARMTHWCA